MSPLILQKNSTIENYDFFQSFFNHNKEDTLPLKMGLLILCGLSLSLTVTLVVCAFKAGFCPCSKKYKEYDSEGVRKGGWLPLSQIPPASEISESDAVETDPGYFDRRESLITTIKDMNEFSKICQNNELISAPEPPTTTMMMTATTTTTTGARAYLPPPPGLHVPLGGANNMRRLINMRRASVPAFLPSEVIEERSSEETSEMEEPIQPGNNNSRRVTSRLSGLVGLIDLRRPSKTTLANSRRMSYSTGHLENEMNGNRIVNDPIENQHWFEKMAEKSGCMSRRVSYDPKTIMADLRPSLYGNANIATNAHGAGILRFSLGFCEEEHYFWIDIHECSLILSQKPREKGRFYVKVRLDRKESSEHQSVASICESNGSLDSLACGVSGRLSAMGRRSSSKKECKSSVRLAYRTATFDETFKFPITNISDLTGCVIHFVVKEIYGGLGGSNFVIGTVTCPLMEMLMTSPQNLLLPNINRDIIPPQKEGDQTKGEVLISLSLDENKEKLFVGLIQGKLRNIPEKIGPFYASLSLMLGEEVVKNQELGLDLDDLQEKQSSNNIFIFKLPSAGNSIVKKSSGLNFMRRPATTFAAATDQTTGENNESDDGPPQAAPPSYLDLTTPRLSLLFTFGAHKSSHSATRRFSSNKISRQLLFGKFILGYSGMATSMVAVDLWSQAFDNPGEVKIAWQNLL